MFVVLFHNLNMLWLCLSSFIFFNFWGGVLLYSLHGGGGSLSFLTWSLTQSHSDTLILKFPLARQFSPNYDSSLPSIFPLWSWFWHRFLSDIIPYQILSESRIYLWPNAHYPSFCSFTWFPIATLVFFLSIPQTKKYLCLHVIFLTLPFKTCQWTPGKISLLKSKVIIYSSLNVLHILVSFISSALHSKFHNHTITPSTYDTFSGVLKNTRQVVSHFFH